LKIALITPTPPDISAFGVRSLSAFLRQKGHQVTLIFLPGGIDLLKVGGEFSYGYSQQIIDNILAICSGHDLVGISFMTQYFDRARQISQALREQYSTPIVWGGFHPTLCPEESLQYADFVVEGEGEEPLLALIEFLSGQRNWEDVPNTWRSENDSLTSPGHYHWMNDIQHLPDFDFSLEDHYVFDIFSRRVVPLTSELFQHILPKMPYFRGRYLTVYRTMTSRGCPHQCSYCINRTLRKRYCQGVYLRRRSVDQVILELQRITQRFPGIGGIHFFDDSFFSNSTAYLTAFVERYRTEIKLPFYCQSSPEALTREKMDLLLEAGMVFCEMGIQTGSESIAKLYRRSASNEQILKGITTIDRYRERLLKPHYHVIVDNPWETVADSVETALLLLTIPHPFMLCLASLTLFPGTELHEKALQAGIITDPIKDVYRKAFYVPKATYLNVVITLSDHYYLPRSLFKLMLSPRIVAFLHRPRLTILWKCCFSVDRFVRYVIKACQAIRYGNFWRFSQFLRRLR